jgi:protein-disulfide isomerase
VELLSRYILSSISRRSLHRLLAIHLFSIAIIPCFAAAQNSELSGLNSSDTTESEIGSHGATNQRGSPAAGIISRSILIGPPSKGSAKAPVTIIEFSDFECPFSAKAAPEVQMLLQAYPDQVRLIFKHKPLPFHSHAAPAVETVQTV